MLAKLPFRSKLLVVVSIPLLVLLVFAGFAISARFDALAAQDQVAELSGPLATLGAVARTVSAEGVASETFSRERVNDPEAATAVRDRARAATDQAIDNLQSSVGLLDGNVSSATQEEVADLARGIPETLAMYRGAVDTRSMWIEYFGPIAHQALDAEQRVVQDLEDRELADGFQTVLDVRRQQVALGDQASVLLYMIRQGAPDQSGVLGSAWVAGLVDGRTATERFDTEANAAYQAAFARGGGARVIPSPIQADAQTGGLPAAAISTSTSDYEQWFTDQTAQLDGGIAAITHVIARTADAQRSDVRKESLIVVGATALLVGGVLVLSWVLVRSVTRPLRALTRAARDMSERRLPALVDTLHRGGDLTGDQSPELAPIRIESEDEVGELAKAFNTIQQVTVSVAAEQSALLRKGIGDLYVNLARRNQSLLDRQISLLDDMEARVEEPDELGALFELDHLATRMRRNAESLLVLSGAEQPRQWGSVVPMLDVARGAAAEIAEFARISYFGFDDDIAVSGAAVADVSHLLAELLENAAAFSPPSAPVVVAGRRVDRRFVITITDEGIGMDDERLASANALLARPPAPGLALSRTLGLYVVAHLAARHRIHVQLRHAPGTGLTAVVALPIDVLARAERRAGESPSPAPPTAAYVAEPVDPEPVDTTAAPSEPGHRREPVPTITWRREGSDEALLRRGPAEPRGNGGNGGSGGNGGNGGTGANGRSTGSGGNGVWQPSADRDRHLTTRTPGANLSQTPDERAPSRAAATRPRPERVAELLNRHEQGKREGRVRPPEDGP